MRAARVAPEKTVFRPVLPMRLLPGLNGTSVSDRKLTDTVWEFLDRAGPMYAAWCEDRFRQEMHSNCLECGMASPIEDLFWIACYLLSTTYYEEWNPDCSDAVMGDVQLPSGVYCRPQHQVDKYRVDFMLERVPFLRSQQIQPPVIVELDGHDFHDKDKRQRAYEKARDRYLVKQGYRVLHFTGSEIVADPFKAAHEALALLNAVSSPIYDPADPFGLGLS